MKNIKYPKKDVLIKEMVEQLISKMLLEQAMPAATPATVPQDPNMVPDPMGGAGAQPDPTMAPTDDTMPTDDASGEDESEENDEDQEDPTQAVIDKVEEQMDTDEEQNTDSDVDTLVNLAKKYIQDYGLLDPNKKHQALSVVERLTSMANEKPENQKLSAVAQHLKFFLSGN